MIEAGEYMRTNPQVDRVDLRMVVAEVGKCMELTAECTEALQGRMMTSLQNAIIARNMLAAASATNEVAPAAPSAAEEEASAEHADATPKRKRHKKEAGTSAAEEAPKKEAGTAAEEALNEQPPGAPADQQPAILPQMDWPLAHKTIKCVVREYMPDPENGETIVIDRIRAEVYKRLGLTAEQQASVMGTMRDFIESAY